MAAVTSNRGGHYYLVEGKLLSDFKTPPYHRTGAGSFDMVIISYEIKHNNEWIVMPIVGDIMEHCGDLQCCIPEGPFRFVIQFQNVVPLYDSSSREERSLQAFLSGPSTKAVSCEMIADHEGDDDRSETAVVASMGLRNLRHTPTKGTLSKPFFFLAKRRPCQVNKRPRMLMSANQEQERFVFVLLRTCLRPKRTKHLTSHLPPQSA
jgi:hypothetical protein